MQAQNQIQIAKLYCEAFGIPDAMYSFDQLATIVRPSQHSFSGAVCEVLFADHFANYTTVFAVLASRAVGRFCISRREGNTIKVSVPFEDVPVEELSLAECAHIDVWGEPEDHIADEDAREAFIYPSAHYGRALKPNVEA